MCTASELGPDETASTASSTLAVSSSYAAHTRSATAPSGILSATARLANQQNILSLSSLLSLHFKGNFPGGWVSRYQNVSILDFIGAKDDGSGGDNCSCKTCKAPVKSSPPIDQHPMFYRADAPPVAQPTVPKH